MNKTRTTKKARQRFILSILWKHPHNKPELSVLCGAMFPEEKITTRTITRGIKDLNAAFSDKVIVAKPRVGYVIPNNLVGHIPLTLLSQEELIKVCGRASASVDEIHGEKHDK